MKAKTLKKGLGIALSMAMTMSLFGCGSGDSAKEQASDTSETTEVAENTDSKDSDTDKGYDFLDLSGSKIYRRSEKCGAV